MGGFSLIHWIILAVLLLLLFGGNRFSAMMGDVAKGLKSFKKGLSDDEDEKKPEATRQIPPAPGEPIDITPRDTTATPPRDDASR